MDRIDVKKVTTLFQKYKYVLLVLLLGIILMSFPEDETPSDEGGASILTSEPVSLSVQLEAILTQISGVGEVKVLLTEAAGAETIYQTDEDRSISVESQSIRTDTVLITDSSRDEQGLIRCVTPPVYLGAIVVCQGGDDPLVKLSVVNAVSAVTGLGTDRITVLKMK